MARGECFAPCVFFCAAARRFALRSMSNPSKRPDLNENVKKSGNTEKWVFSFSPSGHIRRDSWRRVLRTIDYDIKTCITHKFNETHKNIKISPNFQASGQTNRKSFLKENIFQSHHCSWDFSNNTGIFSSLNDCGSRFEENLSKSYEFYVNWANSIFGP